VTCIRLLAEFIHGGEIDQAAIAAGMIVAYLTTIEDQREQLAALDDLRTTLHIERTKQRCGQDHRGTWVDQRRHGRHGLALESRSPISCLAASENNLLRLHSQRLPRF
jgi:hypothetical protein